MTKMVGGFYERNYSVNPHWTCNSILNRQHPATNGVKEFSIKDEWYFNIRLNDKVTPVLQGIPDKVARSGKTTSPRGALKHIVEAEGRKETLLWTTENAQGARAFGFTGGHFHKNWQHDDFRKLVLNAILWTAGLNVPAAGLTSSTPTNTEMAAHVKQQKKKKVKKAKRKPKKLNSANSPSFVPPETFRPAR